jgi:predicted nuclease of predicted toxin-antitoxin system
MTFLLDENFPRAAAAWLMERGHHVLMVGECCPRGSSDEVVFQTAQLYSAVLLTTDKDFYHTIPLLHSQHCGIVVIALHRPNRNDILSKLDWLLTHIKSPLEGKTYLLRDFSYRAKS